MILLCIGFVMLDIDKPQSYSSSLLSTTEGDRQLQTRLGLYQVFSRIYEQNKDLLNEILALEHSGFQTGVPSVATYLQGVVVATTVYVATNLLGGKTQVIPHPNAEWTLGRDPDKAILSIADPRISRCHAMMGYDYDCQAFYLLDRGSTNGTFINDEQIFERRYLQDGDRIRLGGLGFTFFTYRIPLQSAPATNPSLVAGGHVPGVSKRAVGCHESSNGLTPAEQRTYPVQPGRRQCNADVPDDTVIVPTPLRPFQ